MLIYNILDLEFLNELRAEITKEKESTNVAVEKTKSAPSISTNMKESVPRKAVDVDSRSGLRLRYINTLS